MSCLDENLCELFNDDEEWFDEEDIDLNYGFHDKETLLEWFYNSFGFTDEEIKELDEEYNYLDTEE